MRNVSTRNDKLLLDIHKEIVVVGRDASHLPVTMINRGRRDIHCKSAILYELVVSMLFTLDNIHSPLPIKQHAHESLTEVISIIMLLISIHKFHSSHIPLIFG